MTNFLQKTFGGLAPSYYWRHFFFGALLTALMIYVSLNGNKPVQLGFYFYCVINTLLYPYARFVWESCVNFILGNTIFVANIWLMLLSKLFTIALCWCLALFIAPVGLIYLYFHHEKNRYTE